MGMAGDKAVAVAAIVINNLAMILMTLAFNSDMAMKVFLQTKIVRVL